MATIRNMAKEGSPALRMSAIELDFYVTGGTLRPDAPSYVERNADRELLQSLLNGEFCYVLTSRQMGKSSLMLRTAQKLRDQKARVVVLDLTAIGQNLTPEQWYDGLLEGMSRQLRLEDDLENHWKANLHLGPAQRFFNAVRDVALPAQDGPLTIFVDELDVVRSLPFSTDEFFAAIRECFTRRSTEPALNQLVFCLLGVATPSDLIRDKRITPFNVGRRIELNDFTSGEVEVLAKGLAPSDPQTSRDLMARIFHWTRGHPYLTQLLCRAVRDKAVTKTQEVDQICEGLFLTSGARERDDNLLFVRESILRSNEDRAALLELYTRIYKGQNVPWNETDPLLGVLRLSGLVRLDHGRMRVRNKIYEQVFDRAWVQTHMPGGERRRQRRAFSFGLATALASVAVLVAGASLLRQYLDRDPPASPLPVSSVTNNAYFVYQAAGRLLTGDGARGKLTREPGKDDVSTMEQVLKANADSLSLLRMGFRYPCRFPSQRWSEMAKDVLPIKQLSDLLMIEGELKERQGDWTGAVQSYIDMIHLGEDLGRGTPVIGRLVGLACSNIGVFRLARILPQLDAANSRTVVEKIEEFLRRSSTISETVQAERDIVEAEFREAFETPGWRFKARIDLSNWGTSRPRGYIDAWFAYDDDEEMKTTWEKASYLAQVWIHSWTRSKRTLVREAAQFYEDAIAIISHTALPPKNESALPPRPTDIVLRDFLNPFIIVSTWEKNFQMIARYRILRTAAALHNYQLTHGQFPSELAALVPAYLDEVPVDPFIPSEPLEYRVSEGRVVLYSKGINCIDDGGVAGHSAPANADDVFIRDLNLTLPEKTDSRKAEEAD